MRRPETFADPARSTGKRIAAIILRTSHNYYYAGSRFSTMARRIVAFDRLIAQVPSRLCGQVRMFRGFRDAKVPGFQRCQRLGVWASGRPNIRASKRRSQQRPQSPAERPEAQFAPSWLARPSCGLRRVPPQFANP